MYKESTAWRSHSNLLTSVRIMSSTYQELFNLIKGVIYDPQLKSKAHQVGLVKTSWDRMYLPRG